MSVGLFARLTRGLQRLRRSIALAAAHSRRGRRNLWLRQLAREQRQGH